MQEISITKTNLVYSISYVHEEMLIRLFQYFTNLLFYLSIFVFFTNRFKEWEQRTPLEWKNVRCDISVIL